MAEKYEKDRGRPISVNTSRWRHSSVPSFCHGCALCGPLYQRFYVDRSLLFPVILLHWQKCKNCWEICSYRSIGTVAGRKVAATFARSYFRLPS